MSATLAIAGMRTVFIAGVAGLTLWLLREQRRYEEDLLELAALQHRLSHARWFGLGQDSLRKINTTATSPQPCSPSSTHH